MSNEPQEYVAPNFIGWYVFHLTGTVLGVTRFSVNGQSLPNVGSVVSGEIIRQ